MTETTWDPSNTGGWTLSDGNLTAASPDNDTRQNIFVGYGTTPIPDNALTYYEYRVSGARVQTAFTAGFGVHGFDPSNVNITAEGNATFLGFAYNLTITNSGNVIYDPQGNAARGAAGQPPAPNQWSNGSIVGVLVNRINNTAEFTLNGAPQGGFFDISGMAGKTLYPFVDSWFRSGPVATINGGSSSFAEPVPAGYTPLDNSAGSGGGSSGGAGGGSSSGGSGDGGSGGGGSGGGGSGGGGTGTTSNTITVNQPGSLATGEDTITGHESDPSQPVYLSWHNQGNSPSVGNQDVVKAVVDNQGNFSATVLVDHPGSTSTMYDGSSGALTAAWSATPTASASGGGGSTVPPGTGTGPNTITVNQPANLVTGQDTITGTEADASQPVYLSWHNSGSPPSNGASDVVRARVDDQGNFSAVITVDHPGSQSTMYAGNSGLLTAAWSATPEPDGSASMVPAATVGEHAQGTQSLSFLPSSGSGSATAGDSVTVNQPAGLTTGQQTLYGAESDPSQSIFLNWDTSGTPASDDRGWSQATVHGSGRFFDAVNIDQQGVQGTLYYRVGSGPAAAAWSGTPT